MFKVGNSYTKKDLYRILNVPKKRQRGAWDKGLRKYENHYFIFANIGISGRTGHDYDNFWDGDLFFWQAANKSNILQPQIKELLNGKLPVYIFTRTIDKDPFHYEGKGTVLRFEETTPVRIIWKFEDEKELRNERLPEEVIPSKELNEGSAKQILVNKYERNPEARRQCILYYGLNCQVCYMNFENRYGILGKDFIHVHHNKLISSIGEDYKIDPILDLIPICPNCHSMLHKSNPPLTIKDLQKVLKK